MFLDPDSPWHDAAVARTRSLVLGLSGHAHFETYAVLTRLPLPQRRSPASARRAIQTNFPDSHLLGGAESARCLTDLVSAGIAGGAVYDGLVALAAKDAGVPLLSRDRRAAPTYAALGVEFELL